jgi:hypothetical protein
LSSTSLWARDGEHVAPSVYTRGPWDPGLLHGGAVGALLAEIGQEALDPDLQPVRLTIDLMKPVPLQPMTVGTRVLRTGRRLQLVEIGLRFGDALVAQALLLALRPSPLDAGGLNPPLVSPPDAPDGVAPAWSVDPDAESFVGGGQEFRFLPQTALGAGIAWFRLRRPVLDDGRPASPLARAAAAADVGGAVSARRGDGGPPASLDTSFVNADISIHLARLPEGEWLRLASTSRWEATGIGFVDSDLADAAGGFGSANQALVLERRS